MMTQKLCAVLLAAGILAAPTAAAGPKEDAEASKRAKVHFAKGTKLYKQARYKDAITEFETAYKLRPHGVLFFNIAQSHEKLGDIALALKNYHEYLRSLPNAEDRGNVEVAMKNLEKRLAAKGVQQLLIYSSPPNARVLVDGKPAGVTPFTKELPLGKHTVGVEIEGYALNERTVELTETASIVLDFTLEKRTETVPLLAAPEDPKPEVKVAAKDAPIETKTTPEVVTTAPTTPPGADVSAGPPPKKRVWTYVAGGAAVAAVATAAVLGSMAQADSTTLTTTLHANRVDATATRDAAEGKANAANVLYGVAGVAGAATIALFFVEGSF